MTKKTLKRKRKEEAEKDDKLQVETVPLKRTSDEPAAKKVCK